MAKVISPGKVDKGEIISVNPSRFGRQALTAPMWLSQANLNISKQPKTKSLIPLQKATLPSQTPWQIPKGGQRAKK